VAQVGDMYPTLAGRVPIRTGHILVMTTEGWVKKQGRFLKRVCLGGSRFRQPLYTEGRLPL
jgi:hypothetical protein